MIQPLVVNDLRAGITGTIAELTPDVFRGNWAASNYRWDICYDTSGSHIEL